MPKDPVSSLIDSIAARVAVSHLPHSGYSKELDTSDDKNEMFMILDPDGDWIATTLNEYQADALLSHLNRGQ